MATVMTFPGKIGDALLQFPVAAQWARQTGKKFDCWLDENTLKPIVSLMEAQPCVENVTLRAGIKSYECGGQPFNFGITTEEALGNEVFHLGFKAFPQRQITLQTALDMACNIDVKEMVKHPGLVVEHSGKANRVVLHGTFASHNSGVPRFWRVLHDIKADLEANFDEIVFVGVADERGRAAELYPPNEKGQWTCYDDGGSFLDLARLMAGSRLVIGSGSSGVALASVLKVPTVRVHDPIGNAPKVIWAGLGDNQWNEEEVALRRLWPEILKVV